MMKPATKMIMSYQNSLSSIDEDTAVPLIPTILSPTSTTTMMTTTSYRSKWMVIAIVEAIMMLVAGGAVLLWDGKIVTGGCRRGHARVISLSRRSDGCDFWWAGEYHCHHHGVLRQILLVEIVLP